MSSTQHPLTLQMKDLNADWRRVNVVGQLDLGGYTQVLNSALAALLGRLGSAAYYTRGETVTIGGETYIIAYRPQIKGPDFGGLVQAIQKGGPKTKPEALITEKLAPEKMTAETTLALSLLNVRTSGSLTDIRTFDLQREIEDASKGLLDAVLQAAGEEQITDPSLRNLKRLSEALTQYAQDNNEVLPPMTDPAIVKEALQPYVKEASVWVHPENKTAYLPNPALSRRRMATVEEYGEWMVAFYEASPAPGGTRGYVTLDGTVKRISENEWEKLKRASKIP